MQNSALHSSSLAKLTPAKRLEILNQLSDEDAKALLYDWTFWARETHQRSDGTWTGQLPPAGDWLGWLILAGRGYGKTRTGAEFVRHKVETAQWGRVALVGRTAADVRDVMVEGESGILAISPAWCRPHYEPSKRRLTWPNGAIATTYSGDQPDQLRGPQHDGAWCDELAAWRYPDAFDQLLFGLRLGDNPQWVGTTTPRPTKLIRELVKDPGVAVTRGSTYENRAFLAKQALNKLLQKYAGTRLGKQELDALILDDVPGALWTLGLIELTRVQASVTAAGNYVPAHPPLKKVAVAIDPAASSKEESSETGIVVGGISGDEHGYVLADKSLRGTPAEWGRAAVDAYHEFEADHIVAEVNQGGEMVEQVLRSVLKPGEKMPPYRTVHASRGKYTRAEPVSTIYEQRRIHHVGVFSELEDQMTTWVPGETSPDRMDANVWLWTDLMVLDEGPPMSKSKVTGLYRKREKRVNPR